MNYKSHIAPRWSDRGPGQRRERSSDSAGGWEGSLSRLRGWGVGLGQGQELFFQPSTNLELFAVSSCRRMPPSHSPPPHYPAPARRQAERWCSPRPGFHHPGPEGGSGHSTGTGRKWSLGVWDLIATLTLLNVGFLVSKAEV